MNSRPAIVRAAVCARQGCGAPLEVRLTGRPRRYCSTTCRVAEHDRIRRQALRDARLEEELRAFRRRRRALLSSDSDLWFTPRWLLEYASAAWGPFDLDPAADPRALAAWELCEEHWTVDDDGLEQVWHGVVWLNPPYGTAIPRWIAKVVAELAAGRVERVVVLVPARPDTGWWAAALAAGAVPEFRRGRVKFLRPDGTTRAGAPFPSAFLVFERSRFVGVATPTEGR